MATFYLIDQSLKSIGGHHFDYADSVMQAARRQGWTTVVGANRRLRSGTGLESRAQVHSVFRGSTYSCQSFIAGLNYVTRCTEAAKWLANETEPELALSWLGRFNTRLAFRSFQRRRMAEILIFAKDCEEFFRDYLFEEGDQVILAGCSELELMGLAAYLANHPRTVQVQWHLLFHFNLFEGRPADYPRQEKRRVLVQHAFEAALSRIPYHRVSFITTTPANADQYNRLECGDFKCVPYPVNPAILQRLGGQQELPPDDSDTRPLVVTSAGAVRVEKGQRDVLPTLVDSLWERWLSTDKILLKVQRPNRRFAEKNKINLLMPGSATEPVPSVRYIDHPLTKQKYVELLAETDIGLLAYDPEIYYARRAGVLGEYLCVGRPVVVLAGGWLGREIAVHTQQYIGEQLKEQPQVWTASLKEMSLSADNLPQPGGICSFDRSRCVFEAVYEWPAPADAAVVEFAWHWPTQSDRSCFLEAEQLDQSGNVLSTDLQALGDFQISRVMRALIPLGSAARSIRIRLSNAFDDQSLCVRDLRIRGIGDLGQTLPRSAVGMVAAKPGMIAAAIAEVAEHYRHYRNTAEQNAVEYRQRANPEKVVQQILSVNAPPVVWRRSA